MRTAIALLMALHGIAHLPGFLNSWELMAMEEIPYHTTVLSGRLDLGDAGIRALGVLWLAFAAVFVACAGGALAHGTWWLPWAMGAALGSLVLSAAEWPEARIGVGVNAGLIAALVIGAKLGWL
ncbi:hypothetical protein [Longimicrobium sp.]|uniref:hypothetical protein n=1 Tax=Longimicrobium sp. TaxID=2029185 RepID=UPI002B61694C|nr:hypothetical protein [Longimicrobium sp.]HSU17978.1 hypothetical protein [Longimicrobium sp.]